MSHESGRFARRALVAVAITVSFILLTLLLWQAAQVLLILFAGVLLAVLLNTISGWVHAKTRIPYGWSLALVVILLAGLLTLSFVLLAPSVGEQMTQLTKTLPASVQQLQENLGKYGWGRWVLQQVPQFDDMVSDPDVIMARASGIFSSTLGIIVDTALFLFVGIYLASEPNLYVNGIIKLVPVHRRERAHQVFNVLGYTLKWWLIGRILSMLLVGIATAIGLWLLDMPLALTFGLLAALCDFIPNIGPIIAAIPAVLLGFTIGSDQALYVVLLYFGVQTFEGFLLTPLVERRTVSLLPVLVLLGQVVLGLLAGGLGVALASPLMAVSLVLLKMLYVEDVLHDEVHVAGEEEAEEKAIEAGEEERARKEKEAAAEQPASVGIRPDPES
jgi:predicted PurR-regulated permease PerM